ncbi:MAG: hypothetical protein LBV04_04660 [Deferribacteraceae bacterium]|jgi:hypothetical protein|nr:hypothetical protein [Deferribacteraceae bacterium]
MKGVLLAIIVCFGLTVSNATEPLPDCDVEARLYVADGMWVLNYAARHLVKYGDGWTPTELSYDLGNDKLLLEGKPFTGVLCSYEDDTDEDGRIDGEEGVLHASQVYKDGKTSDKGYYNVSY